ncbi:MAG: lycopene cyclase domain-containing protein [Chitinophagaceae bacterium]|nr:MAG: lycopene cyclase domain-containing protein [Chitinophagaceae bacterium]
MSWLREIEHLYLYLNIFTISLPFLLSFDKKVAFYKEWRFLFPAILITGAFFIIWDVLKTHFGVWSFNENYLVGIDIINLPLEEWLFFITVPYAIVFIYCCVKAYFSDFYSKYALSTSYFFIGLLFLGAIVFYDKAYTVITFSLSGLFLLLHIRILGKKYLGYFWIAFFIHLIPFLLINGALTSIPVVMYDDSFNMGIRYAHLTGIEYLYIPLEDTIYSMLLFLMNVTIFEWLKIKYQSKVKTSA